MRTLLLSPVYPPARGGIETLAARLAERLPGEVRVVTLASDAPPQAGPAPRREHSAPPVLRVHNVPKGGRRSILRVNFRSALSGLRSRPDVALVMHVKLAPAAALLARARGVPYVQYVHAKEVREVPALARFAMRHASAVIAVSSYSAQLASEAGAAPALVHVIHNGVDLPSGERGQRSSVPALITVSRLEDRYKGHDVLLRALPAIRRQIPDVRWTVVGEGTLRPELERMAGELGVADCVEFVGAVSDSERDALLDRAWVFAMLSREPAGGQAGEGFGIAYLEAGARGLPVIAGRVQGVRDAVADEVTGLLVDPTDVGAVTAAVVRLLGDRGLARRLGEGGLARARELEWTGVVAKVNGVLEQSMRSGVRERPRARTGWGWAAELLLGPPARRSAGSAGRARLRLLTSRLRSPR